MKTQRILIALTLLNLALVIYQSSQIADSKSATERGAILRGSGIEIVDDEGRLRAQLKIEPANPDMPMPDGDTGYPQTVIFRLITADGKPRVKLTTSDQASGLMLLGETDTTHTILQANRDATSLRLRNSETTEQLVTPSTR